jgi:RNA polymerase sigma factor for flagellar operon FliA
MNSDIELMDKVRRIARHYHRSLPSRARVELEDLVQDGMVGMLEAKHRYDPRKSDNLARYAGARISGAILDSLRWRDNCKHSARARIKKICAAASKLSQELGREPTSEETAAAVHLPLNKVYESQQMAEAAISVSLSSPDTNGEHEGTLADTIADNRRASAFDIVVQKEHKELFRKAFRKLNAQERQAIQLYFLDDNEYTLEEVGRFMGVGAPRVSQICSEARRKLAAQLLRYQAPPEVCSAATRTNDVSSTKPRRQSASSTELTNPLYQTAS